MGEQLPFPITGASDPRIMGLDREEQRLLVTHLLRRQLSYVFGNVPFWMRQKPSAPIDSLSCPEDLTTVLGRVLFKDHFRDGRIGTMTSPGSMAAESHTAGGTSIAILAYSGGTSSRTTGKLPTIHFYSRDSWATQVRTMRRSVGGLGERVIAKNNYTMDHFGGQIFAATINGYGDVPPIGVVLPRHPVLNDRHSLDLMIQNRANLLIATPSSEPGKASQSLEDMLLADDDEPQFLTGANLREVWFSSKPPEPNLLEQLRRRGLRARGFYGSAESGILARECERSIAGEEESVVYHAEVGPSWITFASALDPMTVARPGEEAALLVSAIAADGVDGPIPETGRAILNYFIGDVALYRGHFHCDACGVTAPTFADPRRAEQRDEYIESSCAIAI